LTNHFLGLARGPIDHEASSVINVIANEALEMGSCVTLVATIPASEILPRVEESDAAADVGYGIVVGGDTDGIYSTTGAASGDDSTLATNAAGQAAVVVTQGRALARVTNADAIAIGDPLSPSAVAGILELANAITDNIIAIALQVPTGTTDIIAVDIQREGLLT